MFRFLFLHGNRTLQQRDCALRARGPEMMSLHAPAAEATATTADVLELGKRLQQLIASRADELLRKLQEDTQMNSQKLDRKHEARLAALLINHCERP